MIKRFNSEALGLPCKFDTDTGIVTVKDIDKMDDSKYVKYSPEELEVINKTTGLIDQNSHNLKNWFGGTIIDYIKLADLNMSDKFRKRG